MLNVLSLSLSLSPGASLMGAAAKKDFGMDAGVARTVWPAWICMTIPLLADSHKTRVAATFGPGP